MSGFINDDKAKIGRSIQGVKALGGKETLKGWIRKRSINEVIIAMPSIAKVLIKDIVRTCRSEKVKLLIVPSTMEIIEGVVKYNAYWKENIKLFKANDFIAELTQHIPPKHKHFIRY